MSTLPHPSAGLIESLQGVRRKVKVFSVAYGAGLVVAAAVGLLLATVLLDWLLNLPTPVRLTLTLLSLAAVGYAAFRWVVRPLLARLSIGDMAGRLEHAFPQFDDRLRSTVDFVRDDLPGSDTMKRRVVAEAGDMARDIQLDRAIMLRPVWYSAAGAGAALLVLLALSMAAGSNFLGIAANRLFGGSAQYPKTVQIALEGNVPLRVPVGRSIPVKIKLVKGAEKAKSAEILYRYDDKGPWQTERMARNEDGTYSANLDAKLDEGQELGKLQIKLRARDDEMVLAPVTIVPRLDIQAITARITPPPYANRQGASVGRGTSVDLGARLATTVFGSTVDLHVQFNKDLAAGRPVALEMVKPEQKAKAPAVKWAPSAGKLAVGTLTAGESFRFTVKATDADGFENSGTAEYELIVKEDGLPTVQIEEPKRSEDRTPTAEFLLRAAADDDYGFDGVRLVVNRLNVKTPAPADDKNPQPAPTQNPANAGDNWVIDFVKGGKPQPGVTWTPVTAGAAERQRFRVDYGWDLAQLANANLKPGDVLEYFVQVKDNFNLNGKQHDWVSSGKLRITIISQEQIGAQYEAVLEQVHSELGVVKRGQESTRQETGDLAERAQKSGKLDEADQQQASRLANQQGTTAAQTKQASGKLGDLMQRMKENKSPTEGMKQTAAEVSKQLEQAAEGVMKEAAKNIDDAKAAKSDPAASPQQQQQQAQQRNDALAKAQQNQQASADKLQQAMEKLGNFGGLSAESQKVEQILKDQKALDEKYAKEMPSAVGKKPEEMTPQEKAALKEMTEKQNELQKRTDKAIADMEKKSEKMQNSDPAAAQAMKQSAQAGKQQGVPGKQQQAAEQMQQNQQAQAQAAQKKVELGLEKMLEKLKEAERRKLEELKAKLEDLQKQVANLVRLQSGHNIDNLLIQGGIKKFQELTEETRAELMDLAQRDPQDPATIPPVPTVPQLSAAQEQTEQNTRNVAKEAEALPDAGPSSKLIVAAGNMERAIVSLRKSNLPEAYDPPQVEALRALREAEQAVQKKLDDANKQLDEQDQETIRQAYVKLLEAHKKLQAEVLRIDTARGADGALQREDAVGLAQLPGVQGDHIKKATELGEQLEKIGSKVYKWANQDIVKSMEEVKADLAKPATGVPTQAEQQRIAEQLAEMIENLNETQKQKRFASRGGGGGGGQCKGGVKMPTEAELRLLKALQKAVNKSTKTIDAQKVKDAAKLLGLGGRQGDLRNLLDELIQEASEGKLKLDAEPDADQQLPEEATEEAIEDQELEDGLLEEQKDVAQDTVEKNVKLTGDRMARSRQRLALKNDPGKTTQLIQERIVIDLDQLIKLAQQQQSQQQQQASGKKPGQKPGQPKPGGQKPGQQQVAQGNKPGKPGPNTGSTPASNSQLSQGGDNNADLSKTIQEKQSEWGKLPWRGRNPVMEGTGDKAVGPYEQFIKDYYETVAKKASER